MGGVQAEVTAAVQMEEQFRSAILVGLVLGSGEPKQLGIFGVEVANRSPFEQASGGPISRIQGVDGDGVIVVRDCGDDGRGYTRRALVRGTQGDFTERS